MRQLRSGAENLQNRRRYRGNRHDDRRSGKNAFHLQPPAAQKAQVEMSPLRRRQKSAAVRQRMQDSFIALTRGPGRHINIHIYYQRHDAREAHPIRELNLAPTSSRLQPRCKYQTIDGKNVSRLFRKTAGMLDWFAAQSTQT